MDVSRNDIKTFLYTPGKFFKIPDFQRPYSWDKANILNFLEDLEQVIKTDRKHFFGSIVYINEGDDNSTIIDGQQRATTAILMLTAIYHILLDNPERGNILADEILEKYLFNSKDYYNEKNRIKLRTVTTDDKIFKEIFERKNFGSSSKDSKLYQAYEVFSDYFKGKKNLEEYVNKLSNFEIVKIILESSDDNPQKVFESINSTGKPLTDGDKIRNFALMLNNREARDIVLNKYWKKIESGLTEINKDYISDFFKYMLTSRLQREVKIDQVYPEFKKLFYASIDDHQDDIERLESFYGHVVEQLDYYSFLKFNIDEDGDYKIIAEKGFRLNYLKIEAHFPFLMRVMDEYKHNKINGEALQRVFAILESYLARRIICNMPTTSMNKFFSTLHREIAGYMSDYPETNYADIFSFILLNRTGDLRVPKETEIQNAVENNPFYAQKKNYVRYVLSLIDDRSKESSLLKQISDEDIPLTIEHIMPQTLNASWKDELGEDYEQVYQQYIDTLPNLTLTGYNSKYSNNSFQTKKTIENGFNESPLIINQYLKKVELWNLDSIKQRAGWWFDQIDKIWPSPITSFAPNIEETEITFTESDLTGAKIKGIKLFGEVIECNSWISAYELILKKLFDQDSDLYDFIVSDDFLHRYIKTSPDSFSMPGELKNTPYFFECRLSNNYKRDVVARLVEHLEISGSEIKAILDENESSN